MNRELAGRIKDLISKRELNFDSAKALTEEFGVKHGVIAGYAIRRYVAYNRLLRAREKSSLVTDKGVTNGRSGNQEN